MSIGENPQIGFLGHTDTVEYIEDFKNPHTLTLKEGNLYGLGTCDMKGGIAAMEVFYNLIYQKEPVPRIQFQQIAMFQ